MSSSVNQNPKCLYCGNNPIPHSIHWYFESINVLFTPVRTVLVHNVFSRWLKKIVRPLHVGLLLTKILRVLGIIRLQPNGLLCKVSRASVLWEEAERRGMAMYELLLFGRPFDTYLVTKGDRSIVFTGLPRPIGYDDSELETMDDKYELKKKLQKDNVPVPRGGSAATWRTARAIFCNIQKPVIVKPRAGSRGRHSTTYIYTEDDLKKAYRIAKQLCFWVIVEEHIPGPVYRGTVINYVTRGVLRGDSPEVTGDGIHTIEELVAIKNSLPHPGVKDIKLDGQSIVYLQRQLGAKLQITNLKSQISTKQQNSNSQLGAFGEIVNYIPSQGEKITLTEKIGVNYGGSSSEDFSICHPDNKALFERAAKVVGDPIVGFDFIISDITTSWKEQKCGFIEANSLPFISLHHEPLHGKPENVARWVWELVGF